MAGRSDLFALVLSLTRDFALAEEAMGRIPAGQESPRSAREAALAACRSRKRPVALTPAAMDALERAGAARPADQPPDFLRESLARAGGQARSLLAMRYRQGMTVAQIARRTKNTLLKTQKALHRARLSLVRSLREAGSP